MDTITATDIEQRLSSLETTVADLRTALTTERNRFRDFRDATREALCDLHHNHDVDVAVVNEALEALDLDPMEREFEIRVRLVAEQWVDVTVTAANEDDAREKIDVDADLAWNETNPHSWEYLETEIEEVTEAS